MRKLPELILCIATVALVAACSHTPDGVIEPEKMAQLMADFHTAEAVVDMNRQDYRSDSAKQVLRQSVYAKYGVTPAEVDSSLSWYGRNITEYMAMYDRTIEILEHRLIETGNRVAAEAALSIAGDSVDVWPYARYVAVDERKPTGTMTFNFNRDDNWERGDVYVWRTKIGANAGTGTWQIVTEYADGTVEYVNAELSGDGWKDIALHTDSLRDATRVYGYLTAYNRPGVPMRFDSIQMVRKRLDREGYSRRYNTRRLAGIFPKSGINNHATASAQDTCPPRNN